MPSCGRPETDGSVVSAVTRPIRARGDANVLQEFRLRRAAGCTKTRRRVTGGWLSSVAVINSTGATSNFSLFRGGGAGSDNFPNLNRRRNATSCCHPGGKGAGRVDFLEMWVNVKRLWRHCGPTRLFLIPYQTRYRLTFFLVCRAA